MRPALALAVAAALLLPLAALAQACQTRDGDMAARACCRTMQSMCMQGGQAGRMACCHRVQSVPAQFVAASTDYAAPAPVTQGAAAPAMPFRPLASAHWIVIPAASGPPPVALYTLHANLLI